jgi:hypothetical protein
VNIGEDVRISLRSIQKRPVESLLLILGIALGIGATAAGISLISHSVKSKNELLSQTEYKEVVVRVRESAEDMDLSAMPKVGDGNVFLSWVDLAAKNDVPDVEYAYVADRMNIRITTTAMIDRFMSGQGAGQGGASPLPPPGDNGGIIAEPPPSPGTPAQNDGRGAGREQGGESGEPRFEMPTLPEGPEPVIEEMPGMRVSLEYFQAWDLQVAQGSLFTQKEMEENMPVLILGSELAASLFEDGVSLGREVLIMRSLYQIVGILEPTGTSADESAYIPAQLIDIERIPHFARQFVGLNTTLHFTVYDPDRLDEAKSQLTEWFSQVYGDGQVAITIPRVEVEAAEDRTARLVSVILFLAVAGLLIASVNVSNILLGRAMRKRKNVGILKALGASIRDVFGLFFIEALILGASGAILGAGLSILISRLMLVAISGGAVLSIMLFLGILAAWAVTTSLTVIPALQASRIPAAEALRYE